MAFDFGTRQIGLAVGQTLTASGRPLAVLKARDGQPNWQQISDYIEQWQPDMLIVGLPLNMDGSESPFCKRARKFARRLQGRMALPVKMVDERLSTAEAKSRAEHPGNYRDNPVDSEAACLILETWLQDPRLGILP
ncbi:Holliday junction DNA helicase RuvA [Gammaproteobacteria bacterium 53_120_T64]|nr:Holliday junction DNA helicase RuvA [Gammaproteobacteria bacterium 53_120_T64]